MNHTSTGKQSATILEDPLNPRRRAIVIGASSGIGAALAVRLAKDGVMVALLARRKDRLDELCEQINHEAGEPLASVYVHDVTQYDLIPSLFQKILHDMKGLDLMVYVSGVLMNQEISEFDFIKDQTMVEVNLLGGLAWLSNAAILFDRMGTGQIVGIASVAGERGRVKNPGYQASKAGLIAYLESLRNRLSRRGVHVLTVNPGFVDTDMYRSSVTTPTSEAGIESPMVISPDQAAHDIFRAIQRRKQVLYTPSRWRWIMLVIKHIPSFLFRKLSI